MPLIDWIGRCENAASLWLNRLQGPFALVVRWYLGWQFWRSGSLKLQSWESTLGLFRDEYHVPLLPPGIAAYVGTAGELVFPILLFIGFASRFGAIGMFAVNAMAVISYRHVLLGDGFEAALGQHILWGTLATYLIVHGPGWISLDHWLQRRLQPSAGG